MKIPRPHFSDSVSGSDVCVLLTTILNDTDADFLKHTQKHYCKLILQML